MIKKNKNFYFFFPAIVFVSLSISNPIIFAKDKQSSGLGQITAFRGEVLIRSKGIWKKLEKSPVTLYSSDKIVTNRGRVEFSFPDNSTVRLDLDSNVSLVRKKGNIKQINVLLGNVGFDMAQKEANGSQYFIKSPSLKTKISSFSGKISVNLSGMTDLGVNGEGLANSKVSGFYSKIKGAFNKLSDPKPISKHDVTFARMPLSNSKAGNSLLQSTALKAIESQATVSKKSIDEKTIIALAKALEQEAKKTKTEYAKKRSALANVKSANIFSKLALLQQKSQIANLAEIYAEAKAQKIDTQKKLFDLKMKEAGIYLVKVRDKMNSFQKYSDNLLNKIKLSKIVIQANSLSSVGKIIKNSIVSYLAVINSYQSLMLAILYNDADIIKIAEKMVKLTKEIAKKNEDYVYMAQQLEKEVNQAQNLGKEKFADTNALALSSLANVTFTFSSLATTTATISLNALAYDKFSFENSLNTAANFGQLSSTLDLAAGNIIQNAALGNHEQVKKEFEVTESAKNAIISEETLSITTTGVTGIFSFENIILPELTGSESTTKDIETTTETTETIPTSTDSGTGIFIVEPLDLPTASPSQ